MSRSHDRHEGVSCDGCHAENFRCARYKCLVCFDYDLCARCFEAGTATERHTPDHSMQCILTRADHQIFYGGESIANDQAQAFACPYCRNLGFTEASLQEHVAAEHSDVSSEVICPVCAASPSGESNHMTDDLSNHLSVDHLRRHEFSHEESRLHRRVPPAPLSRGAGIISPSVSRGGGTGASGAIISRGRGRGHNAAAAAAAGLSAFARESSDPIAELLSQLGGIRRAGASAVSQIQQLQQQVSRQAPRRTVITTIEATGGGIPAGASSAVSIAAPEPTAFMASGNLSAAAAAAEDLSRLKLPTIFNRNLSEEEKIAVDVERANRSLFVQELLMSTFMRPAKERSKSPVEDGVMKDELDITNTRQPAARDQNEPSASYTVVGKHVAMNGAHYAQNGADSNNPENGPGTESVQGQNAQATATVTTSAPSIRITATMNRPPIQPTTQPSGTQGATNSSGQM